MGHCSLCLVFNKLLKTQLLNKSGRLVNTLSKTFLPCVISCTIKVHNIPPKSQYSSWDIRYFLATYGYRPPSLIYNSPWHSTVIAQVQSQCTTSKHRYSRWNCVAVMRASWAATHYFICTSGSRPPSLIVHPPWRRPVITFVPLCCSNAKDMRIRRNFTYIPYSTTLTPYWC